MDLRIPTILVKTEIRLFCCYWYALMKKKINACYMQHSVSMDGHLECILQWNLCLNNSYFTYTEEVLTGCLKVLN